MNEITLYTWMTNNLPIPYEVRMLYQQLGKSITKDEAWWICWLHGVKCTGPHGQGFTYFAEELEKRNLLPPHNLPER